MPREESPTERVVPLRHDVVPSHLVIPSESVTRGEVSFRGVRLDELRLVEYRRFIGCLPQEFNAYPGLSAREFLDYWAVERGVTDARARDGTLERRRGRIDCARRGAGVRHGRGDARRLSSAYRLTRRVRADGGIRVRGLARAGEAPPSGTANLGAARRSSVMRRE